VLGYLSKERQGQVGAARSTARTLEPKEGIARLRTRIEWLERSCPQAAAILREGLEKTLLTSRHYNRGTITTADGSGNP